MRHNLVFSPCDFETQALPSALDEAGCQCTRRAVVSMFGAILYVTGDATREEVP